MFARLTNPIRIRAGWLLALVYLLCVLAPAAALAAGDAAPCLEAEAGMAAMIQAGLTQADAGSIATPHMRQAGPHDQTGSHDHGALHAAGHHDHHYHDGKRSAGPCCAMLCLSAVTADLPTIAKPSLPTAVLASAIFHPLRSEAPPLLYRPPIT
jgi:hypothetical protein